MHTDATEIRVLPGVELRQLLITAVLSANAQQRRERFALVLAQPDPAHHAVELLRSPRTEVVLGALAVLEERGDGRQLSALAAAATHDDDRVRARAIPLMVRWMATEEPDRALCAARVGLSDLSPLVRAASAEAVAQVASPLPLEFLEQRLCVERDVGTFSALMEQVRRHPDAAAAPLFARLAIRESATYARPEILEVLVTDLERHGHVSALRLRRHSRSTVPARARG